MAEKQGLSSLQGNESCQCKECPNPKIPGNFRNVFIMCDMRCEFRAHNDRPGVWFFVLFLCVCVFCAKKNNCVFSVCVLSVGVLFGVLVTFACILNKRKEKKNKIK